MESRFGLGKGSANGRRARVAGALVGAALAAAVAPLRAVPTVARAADCPSFAQFSWSLDPDRRTLKRIGAASGPLPFCIPPYEAGDETARLELRDARGAVVYSRRVFLEEETHFDALEGGGLRGGSRVEPHPVLRAHLPATAREAGALRLRIYRVPKNGDAALIAEGSP